MNLSFQPACTLQSKASNASAADLDLTLIDMGPLAWELDELRKSLEASNKALRRFLRDAVPPGSDLE